MLSAVAARQNVPAASLDRLIDAASRGAMEAPVPSSREEAQVWLSSMADTALADGKLQPQEFAVLCNAGETVGLSQQDIKMLINRVKAQRYEASVAALRQQRGS